MQDYGGPVGFRIISRHPEWLEWLIIQNTNAYEVGFTPSLGWISQCTLEEPHGRD